MHARAIGHDEPRASPLIELLHLMQVYDRGAVRADEVLRIEGFLE